MIVSNPQRQWPPPNQPWLMFMRWMDLAFLHWAVDPEALRTRIPDGLTLDVREGKAWLGITPFLMTGVRPRFMPSLPYFSTFPELNVRTYVTRDGKPGIWFFSLDAANHLAVWGARLAYMLPYHDASMAIKRREDWIDFRSVRTEPEGSERAELVCRYRSTGEPFSAPPGSLDYWLTERYCLYTSDRTGRRIFRGEVHHRPWPLQPAVVEIESNTMASANGIELPAEPPLVHYSRSLDVKGWYPSALD